MTALIASAPALPLGQAGKFVAGAYIVVFVVIGVYVVIMATRAQRTERELEQLRRDVEAARASSDRTQPEGQAPDDPASTGDPERSGSLL